MSDSAPKPAAPRSKSDDSTYRLSIPAGSEPGTIVVQLPNRKSRRWIVWLLLVLLVGSVIVNLALMATSGAFGTASSGPEEKYYDGDKDSDDKIAVIRVKGTIMPPLTGQVISSLEKARDDDDVKGVLLVVDSPGGLVADSHQIFHRLKELGKPVNVSMGRLAASGGYYVSMGAGPEGRIFAEPTTWTGSIGVIIPRYKVEGLAEKIGIESDPLKTGPFKDALSPFKDLSPEERAIWDALLEDSFDRFLTVIEENRPELDRAEVEAIATGQIYSTDQALNNGLIDEVGFEQAAVDDLKKRIGLNKAKLVIYQHPKTLLEVLLTSVKARDPHAEVRALAEGSVPKPYYLYSWGLGLPGMTDRE